MVIQHLKGLRELFDFLFCKIIFVFDGSFSLFLTLIHFSESLFQITLLQKSKQL